MQVCFGTGRLSALPGLIKLVEDEHKDRDLHSTLIKSEELSRTQSISHSGRRFFALVESLPCRAVSSHDLKCKLSKFISSASIFPHAKRGVPADEAAYFGCVRQLTGLMVPTGPGGLPSAASGAAPIFVVGDSVGRCGSPYVCSISSTGMGDYNVM